MGKGGYFLDLELEFSGFFPETSKIIYPTNDDRNIYRGSKLPKKKELEEIPFEVRPKVLDVEEFEDY